MSSASRLGCSTSSTRGRRRTSRPARSRRATASTVNTTASDRRGPGREARARRSTAATTARSSSSPTLGVEPGPHVAAEPVGHRRHERDRGDRDHQPRSPRRPAPSRRAGCGSGVPPASAGTVSASARSTSTSVSIVAAAQTHEQPAAVGARERRVPQRGEPAEAEQHDRGPARRDRRQREHAERRPRPRPPSAPRIHGKCACSAAMPPTDPSAIAAGIATIAVRRARPGAVRVGRGARARRSRVHHFRRPAVGRLGGRARRSRARAGARARARRRRRSPTGTPSSNVPHHTTPPAASVAVPIPAARLAADLGRRAAQVDDERDAERGRRLVLAHDDLAAPRARGPVHEARRIARRVRPHRAHGVAAAVHEQRRTARDALVGHRLQHRRARRSAAARPTIGAGSATRTVRVRTKTPSGAERAQLDAHRPEHAPARGGVRERALGRRRRCATTCRADRARARRAARPGP